MFKNKRFDIAGIALIAAFGLLTTGCGDDDPAKPGFGPVVQFDLSDGFDSDVVVNAAAGAFDTTQEALDDSLQGAATNYALVTQTAAELAGAADPTGLPDDGLFPANDDHPGVRLAYRNSDDGHNAFRFMNTGATFDIDVPDLIYSRVHLFMLSGQGSTTIDVILDYEDGSDDAVSVAVPDWFNEITPDENRYYLIDGMDRMRRFGNGFNERNDAAIFGFALDVDDDRRLTGITLRRIGSSASNTVCTLLGGTGEREL